MAYLFKHTSLQVNFNVNLTALGPHRHDGGGAAGPFEPEGPLPPLPRLPPRRRDAPPRARAARAARAVAHPGRVSQAVRRLGSRHQDHPRVRFPRRGARGVDARLQARRGASRRDSRDAALSTGSLGDREDPHRAAREAEARDRDRAPAEEPEGALESRRERAARAGEEVRGCTPQRAQVGRRAGVRRRGVRSARGRDGGRHARRLDEAGRRDQGPQLDTGARGRPGEVGPARQYARLPGAAFQLRRRLRDEGQRGTRHHRLRRARAVASQLQGRRANRQRRSGRPSTGR